MDIFGFELKRKKKEEEIASVVSPSGDDGSIVYSSSAAAYYAQTVDMESTVKNEKELITRYREVSIQSECDAAIEEITNEAICLDNNGDVATLNLEELKVSESIKNKIQAEFKEVKSLLQFEERAHDLFKSWYVDGRQFHIVTLDANKPKDGILKVDIVDSKKIKKVKNIEKKKDPKTGVELVVKTEEFFVYNEKGIDSTTQGVKLSADSVVQITSGLFDANLNVIISHLHKAIKPANQLRMMEDALVIYRIARAPERRVFYIDVGNLPKLKAEQYVADIMTKYKNKITYDASTGEIKDGRKHMSMLEDFWMPRREGGKGTEITTLPGGQTLGQMEDVEYFKQKLYQSLNVPISRLLPQQNFTLGRSNEITRDELKFNKFVDRLRNRFSHLLIDLLKIQLVAKNIVTSDDWKEVEKYIKIDFFNDNNFVEVKEAELWQNRLALLVQMEPFVGKYFSTDWIKANVLQLTEEDIKTMDQEISANGEEQTQEPDGTAAPEQQ